MFSQVVAVAIGAAMEGCKSSSEEQATNAWKQAEKDMKKVTDTSKHEMKACDDQWKKSSEAIDTAELAA